jgi:hypothetical protein
MIHHEGIAPRVKNPEHCQKQVEHLVDNTNAVMVGGLGENNIKGFTRVSISLT